MFKKIQRNFKILLDIFIILITIFAYFKIEPITIKNWLISLNSEYQIIHFFIKYSDKHPSFNIFIMILLIILLLNILYFLKQYKIISSNVCKKLNIFRLFKIFNPIKLFIFIREIHNLEHILIEQKKILKQQGVINNAQKYQSLRLILTQYQTIMNLITKDVSINIKFFFEKDKLKTFIRIPSKYEINKKVMNELDERIKTEEFKILDINDISEVKNKSQTLVNYSVNTSYNEVVNNNKKFFICNNLPKATKLNKYFSTSKNYDKYYKSLAIFLISDKTEKIKKEQIKGLLIFDSLALGNFEYNYVSQLGGYLAHKIYNFIEINDIKMC